MTQDEILKKIQELGTLYKDGLLTKDEFEAQKKRLLSSSATTSSPSQSFPNPTDFDPMESPWWKNKLYLFGGGAAVLLIILFIIIAAIGNKDSKRLTAKEFYQTLENQSYYSSVESTPVNPFDKTVEHAYYALQRGDPFQAVADTIAPFLDGANIENLSDDGRYRLMMAYWYVIDNYSKSLAYSSQLKEYLLGYDVLYNWMAENNDGYQNTRLDDNINSATGEAQRLADFYMPKSKDKYTQRERQRRLEKVRYMAEGYQLEWIEDIVEAHENNPIKAEKHFPINRKMIVRDEIYHIERYGKGFSYLIGAGTMGDTRIYSNDDSFANLDYPCVVIMEVFFEGEKLYHSGEYEFENEYAYIFSNARLLSVETK